MDVEHKFNILIAGDSDFQEDIRRQLFKLQSTLHSAASNQQIFDLIAQHPPQLIVIQFDAPALVPFQILDELAVRPGEPVIVMLAANPSTEAVVKCLKMGAREFLQYPEDLYKLPEIAARLSSRGASPERHDTPPGLEARHPGLDFIIGNCEKMVQVKKMVARMTKLKWVTVLILGETGTGKEVIARAIHDISTTLSHEGNFVEVNCTAIPENLLEAELFGYEKGAFTDAKNRKPGLLELAEGGSLFLDEIGDMSLNLQVKLLKAIEEKKFRRLGGTIDLQVNTRIIAGTNSDLKRAAADGRFRQDLYYRLNVMNIELPPLREREGDILLLAQHFLQQFSQAYETPITEFASGAKDLLSHYSWPGNVRELRHVVERAVLLAEQSRIEAADIRSALGISQPVPVAAAPPPRSDHRIEIPIPVEGMSLKEGEKRLIEEVLKLTKWNRSKAAEILGVSRPRLRRKIDEYHIDA